MREVLDQVVEEEEVLLVEEYQGATALAWQGYGATRTPDILSSDPII